MSKTREVLFEMTPVGNVVRVTAVDTLTGLEATIQGPASAGPEVLKRTALLKLRYLLDKEKKK